MQNKKLTVALLVAVVLGGALAFGPLSSEDSEGRARRAFKAAPSVSGSVRAPRVSKKSQNVDRRSKKSKVNDSLGSRIDTGVESNASGSTIMGANNNPSGNSTPLVSITKYEDYYIDNFGGVGNLSAAPFSTTLHTDAAECRESGEKPMGSWKITTNRAVRLDALPFKVSVRGRADTTFDYKLSLGKTPGGTYLLDKRPMNGNPMGTSFLFNGWNVRGGQLTLQPGQDYYATLYGKYKAPADMMPGNLMNLGLSQIPPSASNATYGEFIHNGAPLRADNGTFKVDSLYNSYPIGYQLSYGGC